MYHVLVCTSYSSFPSCVSVLDSDWNSSQHEFANPVCTTLKIDMQTPYPNQLNSIPFIMKAPVNEDFEGNKSCWHFKQYSNCSLPQHCKVIQNVKPKLSMNGDSLTKNWSTKVDYSALWVYQQNNTCRYGHVPKTINCLEKHLSELDSEILLPRKPNEDCIFDITDSRSIPFYVHLHWETNTVLLDESISVRNLN